MVSNISRASLPLSSAAELKSVLENDSLIGDSSSRNVAFGAQESSSNSRPTDVFWKRLTRNRLRQAVIRSLSSLPAQSFLSVRWGIILVGSREGLEINFPDS